MIILVATPQYLTRYGASESPDGLNRFRAVVLVERGSVQPWTFGAGPDARLLSLPESFAPAILNRCGWVSLNIWDCPGAGMALRCRTQRRYCYTSSDSLRTNCADTCAPTCQPPAVHQSTHLHRAPGEDFRALFPVQSGRLIAAFPRGRVCRSQSTSSTAFIRSRKSITPLPDFGTTLKLTDYEADIDALGVKLGSYNEMLSRLDLVQNELVAL